MRLGDARSGKLADNLCAFGRTLRRAGLSVDASRMALASEAALLVGLASRQDVCAALESILVSREADRMVFRELFDAYFRDPEMANKLLSQMLPSAEGKAESSKRRPRVREALTPLQAAEQAKPKAKPDQKIDLDAAMTASDAARLRHADFNGLSASEYQLVQRLVRDIALPIPGIPTRRARSGRRGSRPHWPGILHEAAQTGGEVLRLPRWQRQTATLPLLVLVDVSGSMERYARLLLAFLHAATADTRRRDVFAFGTHLTDLTPAFSQGDTDAMLASTATLVDDFAGGTRLGESISTLRRRHARRLVGRRTLVLLISDGLDTGEPALLASELAWLRRHSRRLLWLNPLLRFDGYAPIASGAAVLYQQADAMLAVHNLERLRDLASSIAALMRR